MATGKAQRRRGGGPPLLNDIKQLILDRKLRPGDRLPTEHQLSDQLGASRNAVREALQALEAQGILEIRHGHGIYIREITLSGVADILTFWTRLSETEGIQSLRPIAEVREALETTLLGAAVQLLTAEDIDELDALVKEMETNAAQGEWAQGADQQFHNVLYRPLGNWVLIFLLEAFWEAMSDVGRDYDVPRLSPDEIVEQHRAILSALVDRDADAALAAMRSHFNHVFGYVDGESRPAAS